MIDCEMVCHICGNRDANTSFEVHEMMIGLREVFTYMKCNQCGCLQIINPPDDLSRYYPDDYYSMSYLKAVRGLKQRLIIKRDRFLIENKGFTGRILSWFFPDDSIKYYSGLPLTTRILDVGCGKGKLLYRLREIGFENVLGLDPFISESITYQNGLKIEKKMMSEIDSEWDLITYHHSFEHIPDPVSEINRVSERLSSGGLCILRVPFADSFAWDTYGTSWVQIDAPRHYFIYSHKSISYLIRNTPLVLEKVEFDSDEFQFWGSEQYKRNIALNEPGSFSADKNGSAFTGKELRTFRKKAVQLNKAGKGDQVVLYLRKK